MSTPARARPPDPPTGPSKDLAADPSAGASPVPAAPRWTLAQRRLHWIVALAVAGQYLLQGPMRDAVDAIERGGAVDALGFLVTTAHTWSGATIGLLLAWRLALRRARARERARERAPPAGAVAVPGHAAPAPIATRLREAVARANHAALYLVTGAMVASGSLHWYAGLPAAADWHGALKWALAALVALHVAAALWHALVRRDGILPAMTGGRRPAARLDRRRRDRDAPSASPVPSPPLDSRDTS